MKRRIMNPEDVKNQLENFGMVMRDEEFFKKSEEVLKDFIIPEPKKAKKVSDEEKVEKDAEGQT